MVVRITKRKTGRKKTAKGKETLWDTEATAALLLYLQSAHKKGGLPSLKKALRSMSAKAGSSNPLRRALGLRPRMVIMKEHAAGRITIGRPRRSAVKRHRRIGRSRT